MKRIALAFVLMILSAAVARAGTTFNFSPATDGTYQCGNYCTGFVTDSADTVESVTVQYQAPGSYRVTISIDGASYQGYAPGTGAQFTALAASGAYALVSVNWTSRTTCTHSGRGQHCTTWYAATGGSVAF